MLLWIIVAIRTPEQWDRNDQKGWKGICQVRLWIPAFAGMDIEMWVSTNISIILSNRQSGLHGGNIIDAA
jgi:hypothetical protein